MLNLLKAYCMHGTVIENSCVPTIQENFIQLKFQWNLSYIRGCPKTSAVRVIASLDKGGRRFFRCKRTHFLVQKTSDFSKFMVYPQGQGGKG